MKNIFPVSKTLSFRLIPIGETERKIREKGYLDADKTLAEDCKAMKAAADFLLWQVGLEIIKDNTLR